MSSNQNHSYKMKEWNKAECSRFKALEMGRNCWVLCEMDCIRFILRQDFCSRYKAGKQETLAEIQSTYQDKVALSGKQISPTGSLCQTTGLTENSDLGEEL